MKIDRRFWYAVVVVVIIVAVILGWSVFTSVGRFPTFQIGPEPGGWWQPPFDFRIGVNPYGGTVIVGDSIGALVTATLISGSTQSVSFSASGLPSGANINFIPSSSCNPTCSSNVIIYTSNITFPGNYTITIRGGGEGKTRTTRFILTVVRLPGDVNGDCVVDDTDLDICIDTFGTQPGMAKWNPDCDWDNNGSVDGTDIAFITAREGNTC
jgi:hypothetical protein